jgi:hypothetical protein
MIPTIRSIIVAVLLTVAVLVGGFGLFAAFRVNHEPLARLPVAATPFQLASIDGAPRALGFASDQPRLETNEGLRAVATVVSTRDADQTDAPASPPAVPVDEAAHQTEPVAAPEHVATAPVLDSAPTDPPNDPASSPVPIDVSAAPASATMPPEISETPAPAAEPPQLEAAVAAASPPVMAQPETVTVTGSIAEMPPQQAAAPVTAAPITPAATARAIANRKRIAALRRVHRARVVARALAANQNSANRNSGFGQANFQSASGFQSAQSGIGGPFVSPPAAARRQN